MKRAPLTPHERHILMLAACGLSNPEIAARLGPGVTTPAVGETMYVVYNKLGLPRRQRFRAWRRHRAIWMFFTGEAL